MLALFSIFVFSSDIISVFGAAADSFCPINVKELPDVHKVFEADHPLTQADKLERIARAGWTIPKNLKFIPVDFSKDSLPKCLLAEALISPKNPFSRGWV